MTKSINEKAPTIHDDCFHFEIYDNLKIADEVDDNDLFKTSATHTIAFFFRLPVFEQEAGRKAFLELELFVDIPHNSTNAKTEAFSLNLNDLDLTDEQAESFYYSKETQAHILVSEKCPITKYNFYEFINAMSTKHINNYLSEIKYPAKDKEKIITYFSQACFEAINSLTKSILPNLKCDNTVEEFEDMAELIEKLDKKKNFLNLQDELRVKDKSINNKKI